MKTTVDIPEKVLKEAMKHSKATTKREAIVGALEEFNRLRRMRELVKLMGTSKGFMTAEELDRMRSED